jgi:hypothetical protein
MKNLVFACILAISAHGAFAQADVKTWTRLVGSGGIDQGFAVAADQFGNGIIAGATQGSLAGGNAGAYDLFVAKYDAAGNLLWLRQRGSSQKDFAYGVATDASGNVYVTGYTMGGLDGNSHIGANTYQDVFLTKFDASGNWQWTIQDGTGQADEGRAVCTDRSGNIYITGYVRGDFHGITRVGTADVFISKYNSAGTRLWSALFGSPEVDESFGITCDAAGNVFVTGWCSGNVEGNAYLGNGDNYLVKYDTNGQRKWLRVWGTVNKDTGYALATDAAGNVYVSGYTTGQLYGSPQGNRDYFLAKYDAAGTRLWGNQVGTGEHDQGWGAATDAAGNVYVAGESGGSLYGNAWQGLLDIFLSKYSPDGTRLWTTQVGTAGDDLARGVAVATNGVVFLGGYTAGSLDGIANQGGDDAFIMKFTPVPPSAPTATAATAVTGDAFTANWSSSIGATGYRLDLSADSTFGTYLAGYQNFNAGTALGVNVTGLSAATTYYYRVRAYNSNGTSDNSATISVTTPLTLEYARRGSDLELRWPTNAVGFALQYATDLPPTNWTPASPAPMIVSEQYLVTNAMTDAVRYYRLSKP